MTGLIRNHIRIYWKKKYFIIAILMILLFCMICISDLQNYQTLPFIWNGSSNEIGTFLGISFSLIIRNIWLLPFILWIEYFISHKELILLRISYLKWLLSIGISITILVLVKMMCIFFFYLCLQMLFHLSYNWSILQFVYFFLNDIWITFLFILLVLLFQKYGVIMINIILISCYFWHENQIVYIANKDLSWFLLFGTFLVTIIVIIFHFRFNNKLIYGGIHGNQIRKR